MAENKDMKEAVLRKTLFQSKNMAQMYSLYRDVYPDTLAPTIMDFVHAYNKVGAKLERMVEVGCGSGQAIKKFVSYFDNIIGIDISAEQIQEAEQNNPFPNVSYAVGDAYQLPFDTGSVDVVLCGEAIHFFDVDKFLREVTRVLRPQGCVAIFGYWMPVITPVGVADAIERDRLQKIGSELARKCKVGGCYMEKIKSHLTCEYKDIYEQLSSPDKVHNTDLKSDLEWNISQLLGYFNSLSPYNLYMKKKKEELERISQFSEEELKKHDINEIFRRDLKKAWNVTDQNDTDVWMKVEFGIFVVMGNRPVFN
ncbi:putative methyltransferase DDB_G0268948 [Ciona intestinalis]